MEANGTVAGVMPKVLVGTASLGSTIAALLGAATAIVLPRTRSSEASVRMRMYVARVYAVPHLQGCISRD